MQIDAQKGLHGKTRGIRDRRRKSALIASEGGGGSNHTDM